jgi:hypothetical protein
MYYKLKLEENGNHNEDTDKNEELLNKEKIFHEITEQPISSTTIE